jgi:hypothetical protein
MGEKSEGGELIYLGIEREKRKFDEAMDRLQKLLAKEQEVIEKGEKAAEKFRPGLLEDIRNMRKEIMKFLSDQKLDPKKADELLKRINEAERGTREQNEK